MRLLLIATTNQGKTREIQALLSETAIRTTTPMDLKIDLEVIEDGGTYQENASKKATAFAQSSGLISLADDSGLEVDALDGAPGLHSARFSSKKNAKDADRRLALLANLRGKPKPWTARFRCVVAVAVPGGDLFFSQGECPGEIISYERGEFGFGYDPIFWLPYMGKTMAELTMIEKNQISHRALAVKSAMPVLRKLFQ